MAYFTKAAYAGLVALLSGLLAALQSVPDGGIGDISTASWVTIALATVVAIGGILGLQAAPAKVATSVRETG